jgi:hypothetical protein
MVTFGSPGNSRGARAVARCSETRAPRFFDGHGSATTPTQRRALLAIFKAPGGVDRVDL